MRAKAPATSRGANRYAHCREPPPRARWVLAAGTVGRSPPPARRRPLEPLSTGSGLRCGAFRQLCLRQLEGAESEQWPPEEEEDRRHPAATGHVHRPVEREAAWVLRVVMDDRIRLGIHAAEQRGELDVAPVRGVPAVKVL